MPKINVYLNPGDKLPEEIKDYIRKNFNSKVLDKLFKFGGRIQISITAPYNSKKEIKQNIVIDDDFISQLKISRDKSEILLKRLSVKQLKEIAKTINFPVGSKSTKAEIINNLLGYLFSKNTWKGISE